MAGQEAGNSKPAVVANLATRVNKGAKLAVVEEKSRAIAPAQTRPAAMKAKPATQARAKATSKGAPKSAPRSKITGEQHKKVARFDWLLRTFLNALNAIYDEFDGIPEQLKIIDVGIGRHHAQAVVDARYRSDRGEADEEEGSVDHAPQLDINKLLIANSWDESKRLKGPNIPHPMPENVKLMTQEYSNQGLRPQPSQYTLSANGGIHVADPIYQKPEHILQILGQLQHSPLGSTSDSSVPVTPNISIKDGNVTLAPAQWDVVKDCLTVVHYMNDHSEIGPLEMYQEARVSWIRMFGWAPDIDEMIQAKQRAQKFREEEGLHVNALGTRVWISAEKGARDRRDCAVYRPAMEQEAPEAPKTAKTPAIVRAAHVPQTLPIKPATTVSGAASHPGDSSVEEAEMVIFKAAVAVDGRAFFPTRTSCIAKGPVLPSMAAHTLIYHYPRPAHAFISPPSMRTEIFDISDDENERDATAIADTALFPTKTLSRPAVSAPPQTLVGGNEHRAEKRGQHTGFNPTKSEPMDSLTLVRDSALDPESKSQDNNRKRKASSGSPSSSPSTSKRQAMGLGAQPEANTSIEGFVGRGMTSIGDSSGIAPEANEYMRWEDERKRLKEEKNEARLEAAKGGVSQNDVTMNFS